MEPYGMLMDEEESLKMEEDKRKRQLGNGLKGHC